MRDTKNGGRMSRQQFLKFGGGVLAATAGAVLLPRRVEDSTAVAQDSPTPLPPKRVVREDGDAPAAANPPPNVHIAATDGWIYLPGEKPGKHPDDMAPPPFNAYIFGFRDVTDLSYEQTIGQKMKAQLTAPMLYMDQGQDYVLKLTNLGLALRPDLVDSHTIHWHGFRNAIPIFDGEPTSSVAVPIIRDLTYFYRPHDPGTYMYHCHFEETEHVHMGMIGGAAIHPILNQQLGRKFAYNDEATEYDREFMMVLSEFWIESHWADSHVQLPEWSEYDPEIFLINGRAYPDTLAPGATGTDAEGNQIAPAGRPDLQHQPISSLVTCNSGDRVLLRLINLGFQQHYMTLGGIRMRVIGKDATQLKGRPPSDADLSYMASTVALGPGESLDAIFIAPPVTEKTTYLFYNRNFRRLHNGGGLGPGGMMTHVEVYPTGTLPTQLAANT